MQSPKITHELVTRTKDKCPQCEHETICFRDFAHTRLIFCSRTVCKFITGKPHKRSALAKQLGILKQRIRHFFRMPLDPELAAMMDTITAKANGRPVPGYSGTHLKAIR